MKYIVIEQCKTYSVLLSENGQFYKAANLNYELGETVENPVLMKNKLSSSLDLKWYKFKNNLRYSKMRSVLVSLALVLILVVGIFGGLYYRENFLLTKSSIIMQINPKVELDLNAKGSVIKLKGLNSDGEILLENYKLISKDKVEVTNDLIKRAQNMNFLQAGGKVTLGINAKDEQTFVELGIELREKVTPNNIVIEIVRAENLEESNYSTIPENFKTEFTIKQKSTEQTTSTEVTTPSKTITTITTTTTEIATTTNTVTTNKPTVTATTPTVTTNKPTVTATTPTATTNKPTVTVTTPTVIQSTTSHADSNYGDSSYGDIDDTDDVNEIDQSDNNSDSDSLYEDDD
ncbi:MAG: hypothetical protein GX217_07640 [Clostridiaceae bacterium]|nr:hypothetical protein [Clostridiaceae bacterium]